MSNITNGGLTRSGTGCFIAVPIWQQRMWKFSQHIAVRWVVLCLSLAVHSSVYICRAVTWLHWTSHCSSYTLVRCVYTTTLSSAESSMFVQVSELTSIVYIMSTSLLIDTCHQLATQTTYSQCTSTPTSRQDVINPFTPTVAIWVQL